MLTLFSMFAELLWMDILSHPSDIGFGQMTGFSQCNVSRSDIIRHDYAGFKHAGICCDELRSEYALRE